MFPPRDCACVSESRSVTTGRIDALGPKMTGGAYSLLNLYELQIQGAIATANVRIGARDYRGALESLGVADDILNQYMPVLNRISGIEPLVRNRYVDIHCTLWAEMCSIEFKAKRVLKEMELR